MVTHTPEWSLKLVFQLESKEDGRRTLTVAVPALEDLRTEGQLPAKVVSSDSTATARTRVTCHVLR